MIQRDATHPIALADKADDFMPGENRGAVFAGVEHIGGGQAERINGAIRHANRADQRGIDRRFNTPSQRRINRFGQNARAGAGIDKGLLIAEVIVRQSDKQAAGGFNAVAGDAA